MDIRQQPKVRNQLLGPAAIVGALLALIVGLSLTTEPKSDPVADRDSRPVRVGLGEFQGLINESRPGGPLEGTGGYEPAVARVGQEQIQDLVKESRPGGPLEGTGGPEPAVARVGQEQIQDLVNESRPGGSLEGTGGPEPALEPMIPNQSGSGFIE